jgi:very-short-patch-repair endonuclease
MNTELLRNLFNSNHSFNYDKVESPIEERLLNHLPKFLKTATKIILQYPINTISGNFRADIVLKYNSRTIVLECDGKEHHTKEKNVWYDEWRDTLILIQKKADVIYRIRGTDINNHIYKVISILYACEEDLFDSSMADIIKEDVGDWGLSEKIVKYNYLDNKNQTRNAWITVKRKDLKKDFNRFWFSYVLYSLLYKDKNIYQLITEMSSTHRDTNELIQALNDLYPGLELTEEKQLLSIY